MAIDLTAWQRGELMRVFGRHATRLDAVGVFGSRARGCATPGSDVDLVVFGDFSRSDATTVQAELEESDLSIFADVLAYADIANDRLRAEVDRWVEILFTRDDLLAAA